MKIVRWTLFFVRDLLIGTVLCLGFIFLAIKGWENDPVTNWPKAKLSQSMMEDVAKVDASWMIIFLSFILPISLIFLLLCLRSDRIKNRSQSFDHLIERPMWKPEYINKKFRQ